MEYTISRCEMCGELHEIAVDKIMQPDDTCNFCNGGLVISTTNREFESLMNEMFNM
jgi:hypothetical protein